MSRLCVILAGGEIHGETLQIPEDVYLICADRGLLAAEAMGRTPDYIVGDFDSLGYMPGYPDAVFYPAQKDDTDTMLAVRHACAMQFQTVEIYGGLGGRLDHTLANIQTLQYLAQQGVTGTLISECNRVTLQMGGSVRQYPKREGWYFSLLSFSEQCTGVCASGVEYPLHNHVLTNGFPLGVSNHILAPQAVISLKEGSLLVIESRDSEPNSCHGNIMG